MGAATASLMDTKLTVADELGDLSNALQLSDLYEILDNAFIQANSFDRTR